MTSTATAQPRTAHHRSSAPTSAARHRLQSIAFADLRLSPLNVRKHGPKDIADLAAMIRAHGLLQPLIVRKADDGFEVIAGARRYRALDHIAREDGTAPGDVPCIEIKSCDDARAIEASLAENIARLPMDELDQYAAFAALIKQGRSEDEIASQFGVTPLIVRRRLALARLVPDVQRLYRRGEIDAETLKLLTLASRERQRAYVALLADPEQSPPPRWQLKAWLLGGAEIDTRHALFEEARYDGDISGDLFGAARYFLDAEQFWRLQNEAIAALKADLEAKGWSAVDITGPAEPFYPHQYEERRKADGGHAVIEVKPSGAVEVHKGLVTREEARKLKRSQARAEATGTGNEAASREGTDEGGAGDRPELTAPLANYCDLVRLSAVRAALLKRPKIALRVVALAYLAPMTHVRVTREPMQALTTATHATVKDLPSERQVEDARSLIAKLLGLDADSTVIASGSAATTGQLFAMLMQRSDAEVMQIIALAAADTLAVGTGLVETLGAALGLDCRDHWQPDAALFDLIRDREVAGAMLAEVIGEAAAHAYLTDTAAKKKDIIRNALAGKNRSKVSGWQPRWMTFPQGRYTKRPLTTRAAATA